MLTLKGGGQVLLAVTLRTTMEPLICILPLPGELSDAPEPPTEFFSGSPQKVYRSGTTSYSPKPYTCSNQDSSRVEDS